MSSTYEPTSLSSHALPETAAPNEPAAVKEISLLDLLLVAVMHKKTILMVTGIATLLAVIAVLFMPNYYTGETVLLTPVKRPSISDALMGNFTGVLANLTAGDTLGLKDPNDTYITMLKSRVIADHLISKFHLADYYDTTRYADTLDAFAGDSNITTGHDGTITIDYSHTDPKVAAQVANAYVEELRNLTKTVAITESEQRRLFFKQQFEAEKNALSDSEVALKKSQEKSGMLDLDKQATAMVTAIATLQGQIMGQEILIRGMRSSNTSQNPDVIRAEEQLQTMRSQLADLERRSGSGNGDVLVGTGKIPAAGLEYIRNFRDVKYHEAVFEIVGKQYEAAVMDAGMGGDVIQVISPAQAPDRKTTPHRARIVLAAAFLAFITAYLWAFGVEMFRRLRFDPVEGPKIQYIEQTVVQTRDWTFQKLHLDRLRLRRQK